MKCFCGLMLLAVAPLAQHMTGQQPSGAPTQSSAIRKLNSTLLSLKDGAPRAQVGLRFAEDIALVSDPDHRPSPALVKSLAEDLAGALPAGELRAEMLSRLTTPLLEVLHSAGTSTIGFHESVGRAEKAMIALGIPTPQAKTIGERLQSIGKQVRGPEGVPLQ